MSDPLLDAGPEVAPESEPVGISDGLPAELIDQGISSARREVSAFWSMSAFPEAVLTKLIQVVAPLLVEHGRQQEREAVEARKREYTMRAVKLLTDEEIAKAEARGAEQEKTRWETRIEAAAAEHDEQAEWYEQRAANEKPTSGRGQRYVKSLREDAESERARAARFRSLLTDSEEADQ